MKSSICRSGHKIQDIQVFPSTLRSVLLISTAFLSSFAPSSPTSQSVPDWHRVVAAVTTYGTWRESAARLYRCIPGFHGQGPDDDGGRHRNLRDIESDNGRMQLGDVFGGVCEDGRFALRWQLKLDKAGHRQGGGRNRELFRPVRNLENVGKATHCCEAGDGRQKKKRNCQFDLTL
ncbi:hypothetical protein C8R44DRAFT_850386 [Mycena epipterygia]|nr:hypothetical protein C8R44DRAFT_850386 [Mycena epipterygia]